MKDVFISHSSRDKATADAVVASLEANGLACWIAPRDIPAGSNYGAEITKAIRSCYVLVLLFSADSNASHAVFREVQKAFEEKKIIVPLRIEKIEVGDDLSFYLSGLHWLNARRDQTDFDELYKDIRRTLNSRPAADESPADNPARVYSHDIKDISVAPQVLPKTPASTKNIAIIAASVVICVISALTVFLYFNSQDNEPANPLDALGITGDMIDGLQSGESIIITIHLTINPTVRIDMNGEHIVTDLIAVSSDAEALIEGYDFENKEVTQVIEEIMNKAAELELLSLGGVISAEISAPDDESYIRAAEALQGLELAVSVERAAVTDEPEATTTTPEPTTTTPEPTTTPEITTTTTTTITTTTPQITTTTPRPTSTTPKPTTTTPKPTTTTTPKPTTTTTTSRTGPLTQDEALAIALKFAGVTRSQISDLDIELDDYNGRPAWEIEFDVDKDRDTDDDEWEFYIDAQTGEILYWEND